MFTGPECRDQGHRCESSGWDSCSDSSSGQILRTCDPRTRFRKRISGRADGKAQFLPPHHDPVGTGLYRWWRGRRLDCRCERWHRQRGRGLSTDARLASPFSLFAIALIYRFSSLASVLVLLFLLACVSRRDPQTALDHATQTFRHGDVARAEDEAKRGYDQFHGLSAEWAWKFKLLQADALAWRGMNDRVLTLLASEGASPPSTELAVRKQRLEGLAYAYMHLFSQAERKLDEAEALCTTSNYPACTDVALARGDLKMEQGTFGEAQVAFEQALARARSNAYGRANALLSLSAAALQQEHFDDALSWASAAYQQSNAIDAGSVTQVALGNEGWAYYRLGEPERAFGMFLEARDRAHRIGATADEVKWLTTAGYVYLDAANYPAARQSYQQALDLARKINSKEDILNALM